MATEDPIEDTSSLPSHDVPATRIVAIEHPCIIQNLPNALKSLGGEPQLKHIIEHHVGDSKRGTKTNPMPEPVVGVSLRPRDPFAKKIPSLGVSTRNVLLKVTVPKRTGRKRKRGSDEPFAFHDNASTSSPPATTAPDLLRRLQDNASSYTIQPVGLIPDTHRFRTLPDFQLRHGDLAIMRELRDHVLVPSYDRLAKFSIDLSPSPSISTIFPGPPSFAHIDLPHKYEYQQAPGVVILPDASGNLIAKNIHGPAKKVVVALPPDIPSIPAAPPSDLASTGPEGLQLQRAVHHLRELLSTRPLVTKRVALNAIPATSDSVFKEATQFVGYSFTAGPWRDALIRYGVDPREDPQYRKYQTLMFQIDRDIGSRSNHNPTGAARGSTTTAAGGAESRGNSTVGTAWTRTVRHKKDTNNANSHIFDGTHASPNGKTWQLCDIVDPLLLGLLETTSLREECDVYRWGWYHPVTLAKVRVIMKDKMKILFSSASSSSASTPAVQNTDTGVRGGPPAALAEAEVIYRKIAALPEDVENDDLSRLILTEKEHGKKTAKLAMEVRTVAKAYGPTGYHGQQRDTGSGKGGEKGKEKEQRKVGKREDGSTGDGAEERNEQDDDEMEDEAEEDDGGIGMIDAADEDNVLSELDEPGVEEEQEREENDDMQDPDVE